MTCEKTHISPQGEDAGETDEAFCPACSTSARRCFFAGGDVNLVERNICRMGQAPRRRRHERLRHHGVHGRNHDHAGRRRGDPNPAHRQHRLHEPSTKSRSSTACATRFCAKRLGAKETRERFGAIVKHPSPFRALPRRIISAGSFAVFFGGSALDGVVSALIAVVVCLFMDKLKRFSRTTSCSTSSRPSSQDCSSGPSRILSPECRPTWSSSATSCCSSPASP